MDEEPPVALALHLPLLYLEPREHRLGVLDEPHAPELLGEVRQRPPDVGGEDVRGRGRGA